MAFSLYELRCEKACQSHDSTRHVCVTHALRSLICAVLPLRARGRSTDWFRNLQPRTLDGSAGKGLKQ